MKPKFILFTGLPCSGKTTIADAFSEYLTEKGIRNIRLDGDILRKSVSKDLGFSKEDRAENIQRMMECGIHFLNQGYTVLSSFICPYKSIRDRLREFVDLKCIFVSCPLMVCETRDVKGMYEKARNGEIENFTGIDDPYEEPENPDLILNTFVEDEEQSLQKLVDYFNV